MKALKTIFKQDGIFPSAKRKYSKCCKFADITYAVASKSDKESIFLEYSEVLNSFDTGATTKITILNRRLNRVDFEKNVLLPMNNDKLDEYRKEYNNILLDKILGSNSTIQEKYITISINKKKLDHILIELVLN